MLPILRIFLLGEFRLAYDGEQVTTVGTARLQSLLTYLMLHADAPQSREHIAFRFWPDSTESQARTNLRQLLHQLRRTLPDSDRFLRADTRTLQWRPEAPYELDVANFERALSRADEAERLGDQVAERAALEEAAGLYRGDLLPSCYDDWIEPERDRLRQKYIEDLERLIRLLEDERSYREAISYARRLLQQDPLREATYRCLMRLHTLNGDRASALRIYHACVTVLRRELGVEPDPATRAVHERLLKTHTPATQQIAQPATPALELPLVGRQKEWEWLRDRQRAAADGQPHVVLVTGEAGIGKTRLAEELLQWATHQGMTTARTRCYAAEGSLAYAPVTDWLRADAFRETLRGLDDVWLAEVGRLLPELLVERPELRPPEALTQNWQRQRLFEALSRAVFAAKQQLVLVVDDLQWCDSETLAFLHYLVRFDPSARLLIVGTVRPVEVPEEHQLRTLVMDLRRAQQVTEIALDPLESAETASLAAHVAGRKLDEERAARLHRETEGNPLFVIESVRARLPAGEERGPTEGQGGASSAQLLVPGTGSLPPKVYAVLAERLGQLTPQARKLASLAATIGRSFTFAVLAEAGDANEENNEEKLVGALDELWQWRIVREHGVGAYDFSHDKLREVAYAMVSPTRRRLLHRRIARALETVYASDLDLVEGQVATHYERAGLPEEAIPHYQLAAEVAQRVYANEEAVGHLRRALTLLETLPESPERDERQLALQMNLGVCLVAIKGYGASEVGHVYARVRALCRRLGKPLGPPVLRALSLASIARGEIREAHALGDQLLAWDRRTRDPVHRVEGHYVLGVTSFWWGEFDSAREHLEQALAHYDPRQHSTHTALYAQDPKVVCLVRLALTLWHLGWPDQAEQKRREALALARKMEHPLSLAYTLGYAAWLSNELRDMEATRAQAETAMTLSTEQRLGFWFYTGAILRGWVRVEQGDVEAGITQMREGIDEYRAREQLLHLPYAFSLLARAHARAGEHDRGLRVLDEALALTDRTEERFWKAELYRLRGELMPAQGTGEVEACFRRALDISRRQHAKALELRAAMSLGRLWHSRGEEKRARQVVQDVYNRFTEGFDTPELKNAGTLLRELTGSCPHSRFGSGAYYRSQLKHLNLKSRLPDATEDDVSLVSEALLGLA